MLKKIIAGNIVSPNNWTVFPFTYRRYQGQHDLNMILEYMRSEKRAYYHFRYDKPPKNLRRKIRTSLEDSMLALMLFTPNQEWIGLGELKDHYTRQRAVLGFRFVRQDFSGMGFGTALLELLIKKAGTFPRIDECCFQVDEQNEASHRTHNKMNTFYPHERLGPFDQKKDVNWSYYEYVYRLNS